MPRIASLTLFRMYPCPACFQKSPSFPGRRPFLCLLQTAVVIQSGLIIRLSFFSSAFLSSVLISREICLSQPVMKTSTLK